MTDWYQVVLELLVKDECIGNCILGALGAVLEILHSDIGCSSQF